MYLLEVLLCNPLGPDLTEPLRPAGIGYISTLEEDPLHQLTPLTMHGGQVVAFLVDNTRFFRLCVCQRERESSERERDRERRRKEKKNG